MSENNIIIQHKNLKNKVASPSIDRDREKKKVAYSNLASLEFPDNRCFTVCMVFEFSIEMLSSSLIGKVGIASLEDLLVNHQNGFV